MVRSGEENGCPVVSSPKQALRLHFEDSLACPFLLSLASSLLLCTTGAPPPDGGPYLPHKIPHLDALLGLHFPKKHSPHPRSPKLLVTFKRTYSGSLIPGPQMEKIVCR